jgi:hypothetical protein
MAAIGGFFDGLGRRSTWVRVLQVAGGFGLVVGGAAIIGKGLAGDVAGPLVGAAAGAVTR